MGKACLFLALIFTTLPVFAANRFSILQGSTSDTQTNITVLSHSNTKLQFRARPDGRPGLLLPLTTTLSTQPGSEWEVHRLNVTGLAANTPYILEILDERGQLLEQRRFEALDIHKKGGRIAVGSCMIRQIHNAGIWSNLQKPGNRPDLLMITGDIVYLDRANLLRARNPETALEVWQEFVKSRQTVNLYFWETLVPTLSVGDDPDSGGDNVDAHAPIMRTVRQIYDVFQANDEIPGFLELGPGMAKQFRMFGQNWIFLDGRSFRNVWETEPLYGVDQNRWMLSKVQPGANILVSGTQFFGGPIKKDSLEYNWPTHAKEWMNRLRRHGDWKKAAFAFISGDVHFSEVQDIEPDWLGYWTVEITSSNIHSFGFPGHYVLKPDNPRRREVTGTHNIVLLEFAPENTAFSFQTRALGWRGNDLFKTVVSVAAPAVEPTQSANEPLTLTRCERLLVP